MTTPRWFYASLAIAALLWACSAVYLNVSTARSTWQLKEDGIFNAHTADYCSIKSGSLQCFNLRTGVVQPRFPLKRL